MPEDKSFRKKYFSALKQTFFLPKKEKIEKKSSNICRKISRNKNLILYSASMLNIAQVALITLVSISVRQVAKGLNQPTPVGLSSFSYNFISYKFTSYHTIPIKFIPGLPRLYFRRLFRTLPLLSFMHTNIRMQLKITKTIFQGFS